ncbi:serine hydrolase [Actinokineospora sp. NPDC004072]
MRRLAPLALLLLTACGAPVPLAAPQAPAELVTAPASSSPRALASAADPDVATSVIAAVRGVSRRDTAVGLLVVDRETGAELVSANADRPFRAASLSKLLMALYALDGGDPDRDALRTMLSRSDDQIANVLWVQQGRTEMVVAMAQRLGLTGTRPPEQPNRWGDVLMTPRDLARVYDHVLTLPLPDRALIVDALASAPRVAADGFDQHFGIPDGIPGRWAVKQGWSDSPRDLSVHSTGVVRDRYVVILLTEHPRPIPLRAAAASVTAGARVLAPILT